MLYVDVVVVQQRPCGGHKHTRQSLRPQLTCLVSATSTCTNRHIYSCGCGWLAGAGLLQALSAAAAAATTNILPKAAAAAAATAATVAAGVPAGVSMAYFQGTRYQGRNSLTSPGTYWLRQMGLDDSKVTALLVAANAGCFGMQQVSTTFTSYCVRVSQWGVGTCLVCTSKHVLPLHTDNAHTHANTATTPAD